MAYAFHEDVVAAGLLLTSLGLSGIAVTRGPDLKRSPGILLATGTVFAATGYASGWTAVAGYRQGVDPDQLLLLAVFGVCALTIAVLTLASWAPGWGYREPILLALQALALGGLSLHGLAILSSTLTVPQTSGSVLFYADQYSSQPLYLDVNVTPSPGSAIPTFEFMDINNPSTNSKSASWAVLMTGGAKLTHLGSRGGKVHEQTLSGQSLGTGVLAQTTGQLFWGQLAPGGVVQVTGQPVASYVNRDATETAVALPDFDLGSTINTDPATLSSIAEKLGTPGTSPGGLSIGVDAGSVSPLNTQVTAIPALADPSALSWTFQTDTAPAYKLVDQNAQNSLNSYSFALAVLLGAAGACLLAGLQTLVGKTRSRKEQAARQSKP